MAKKVPLVMYNYKGQEITVGEAEIDAYGEIRVLSSDEEVMDLFELDALSHFSIHIPKETENAAE